MTEHCCPTCGGKLDNQFSWSPETRTFATSAAEARFTNMQAAIFAVIWRARKTGIQTSEEFLAAVTAHRTDGGPECFNNITVQMVRMRKQLEPTGYTITQNMGIPRQGWRLVKLSAEQQHKVVE